MRVAATQFLSKMQLAARILLAIDQLERLQLKHATSENKWRAMSVLGRDGFQPQPECKLPGSCAMCCLTLVLSNKPCAARLACLLDKVPSECRTHAINLVCGSICGAERTRPMKKQHLPEIIFEHL